MPQFLWKKNLKKFIQHRGGNFAILTGVLTPLLLGGAGFAIDLSNVASKRRNFQEMTDYTALSTATALVNVIQKNGSNKGYATSYDKASEFGADTFVGQMLQQNPNLSESKIRNATTVKKEKGKIGGQTFYKITVQYSQDIDLGLMAILGYNKQKVTATSVATSYPEETQAFSLLFATDISESVGDGPKYRLKKPDESCGLGASACKTALESEKKAFKDIITYIEQEDPERKFIRVGGLAFNGYPAYSTGELHASAAKGMSWHTQDLKTQIEKYKVGTTSDERNTSITHAFGYVNDTPNNSLLNFPIDHAKYPLGKYGAQFTILAKNAAGDFVEDFEHLKNGNKDPRKAVIILSDGMTAMGGGTYFAEKACNKLKDAGIEIFAFEWLTPDVANFDDNTGEVVRQANGLPEFASNDAKLAYELMKNKCSTQDGNHFFEVDSRKEVFDTFKKALKTKMDRKPALLVN